MEKLTQPIYVFYKEVPTEKLKRPKEFENGPLDFCFFLGYDGKRFTSKVLKGGLHWNLYRIGKWRRENI